MKISVTQKHIDRASKLFTNPTKFVCKTCPIALAVKDQTHRAVDVGYSSLKYKTSSGNPKIVNLPEKAKKFVETFDNYVNGSRKLPRPFTFEI
jgi:hypothetical protein